MQTSSCLNHRAWLVCFIAFSGITAVGAETPAISSGPPDEVITLQKFVVTGSLLATPADAVPVTVIDAADIRRGGVETNVLEVLRKQMPAFSGVSNFGLNNAGTTLTNSYGGSKLALHNLPTLVLINGRRVATSGARARGGSDFVDVSMFPLAAVDRIEVLSDGASAIYGSDAIGGVVNVILKPGFSGSETGGRYAFSTGTGAYSERSAYFTAGVSEGRVSMVATGNYSKSTPLFQSDRSFSSNSVVSSLISGLVGSTYLDKSLNSPSQSVPTGTSATAANMAALTGPGRPYKTGTDTLNLSPYGTLLAGREQTSAYTGVTVKLLANHKLDAFGDFLYSRAQNFAQLGAQSVTFNGTGTNPPAVPVNSPYNPTRSSVTGVAFRYLPAPRQYRTDAESLRFTAGLKGEINPDWNWETAYTYSRNKLVSKIANVLFGPNLDLAMQGGYDSNGNPVVGGNYSRVYRDFTAPGLPAGLTNSQTSAFYAAQRTTANTVLQPALDPFARPDAVNPASLANILGSSRADFCSILDSYDAVVRGQPYELPGGQIGLAVGMDLRTEKLTGMPDDNSRVTGPTASRWSGGTAFDPFSQQRRVRSVFAEVRIPVTGPKWNIDIAHALDLTAAYRIDDYSDFGESRTPKYGVRWQPLDEQVTVRYTYSEGFAAPNLFDLFGPRTENYASTTAIDGVSRQIHQQTGSNPKLKPDTAKSSSVGVVLVPKILPGLRLSLDYLDVERAGYVNTVGTTTIIQSVEQLGSASPYASQVMLNNFANSPGATPAITSTAPGQLKAFLAGGGSPSDIYVSDSKRNYTAIKIRCVDVKLDYTWKNKSIGEFELGTTGTFFIDDKIQALPTSSFYEYAGHVTTTEGTIPGYRFYSTAGWRLGGWDVQLGNTYIPWVTDTGAGGSASATPVKVYSYIAWDLSLAYTLDLRHRKNFRFGEKVVLRAGVNNLNNKMPPAATQVYSPAVTQPGADTATYSPIGRLYYVSAGFRF